MSPSLVVGEIKIIRNQNSSLVPLSHQRLITFLGFNLKLPLYSAFCVVCGPWHLLQLHLSLLPTVPFQPPKFLSLSLHRLAPLAEKCSFPSVCLRLAPHTSGLRSRGIMPLPQLRPLGTCHLKRDPVPRLPCCRTSFP